MKIVEIRWEGDECFLGKLRVAGVYEKNGQGFFQFTQDPYGVECGRCKRDAALRVEEILTGIREPFMQWTNGEGFVDGVLRATATVTGTSTATMGNHYANDTPRSEPLYRASVADFNGGPFRSVFCLDEPAAKRWCERVIRKEGGE